MARPLDPSSEPPLLPRGSGRRPLPRRDLARDLHRRLRPRAPRRRQSRYRRPRDLLNLPGSPRRRHVRGVSPDLQRRRPRRRPGLARQRVAPAQRAARRAVPGAQGIRAVAVRAPAGTVMNLSLDGACLSLPVVDGAFSFHALTDLSLDRAVLREEEEIRLSRLLSSPCCPRLRRLRLARLRGRRLSVRSDTLENLTIDSFDVRNLEVDAPSLRVMRVEGCDDLNHEDAAMAVAAPKLQEFACCQRLCRPEQLRLGDMSSVRRLEKIQLTTHVLLGLAAHWNAGCIWLLRQCTGVDHVGLTLEWPYLMRGEHTIMNEDGLLSTAVLYFLEDALGEVPTLSNITSLEIDVHTLGHSYEASLRNLLARCQCHSLEFLRIKVVAVSPYQQGCRYSSNCACYGAMNWENIDVPLPRLREVKITGISGTTEEDSRL